MPVRADPADQQLRLDGSGTVHDDHTARVVRGDRGHRAGLARIARPVPDGLGEQRVQVHLGEVADDDRRRRGRADVGVVEGAHGRGVDPPDGLLGALARTGHPGRGGEELLGQLLGGPARGVGLLVRDLVEAVADQALDLALGEGRGPQGLGDQPERLGQAGDRDLEGDPDPRVVRVGVQRGAAALQLRGELLGGALVRALGQGARHDRRHSVQPLGLGVERRVEEDLHGDNLLPGAVAAQYGQPVGQGAALGRGEGPGPGLAGGRLRVVLHRYSSHGGVGHLSAPSCASVPAVSSASSAGSTGS